jgi:hypothetical protein
MLKKYPSQKGLVEWLEVKALSSNPSIKKKRTTTKLPIQSGTIPVF